MDFDAAPSTLYLYITLIFGGLFNKTPSLDLPAHVPDLEASATEVNNHHAPA